jgi:hypothetical protein
MTTKVCIPQLVQSLLGINWLDLLVCLNLLVCLSTQAGKKGGKKKV